MTVGHFNWAYLRAPWGSPEVAGFCDAVDRVNAVAGRSDGFVYNTPLDEKALRPMHGLVRETNGPFDPDCVAATLSVWENAEALQSFVYTSVHGRFLARKSAWFVPQGCANYVIWPIGGDHRPSVSEAVEKLEQLEADGASETAFDFGWMQAQCA